MEIMSTKILQVIAFNKIIKKTYKKLLIIFYKYQIRYLIKKEDKLIK